MTQYVHLILPAFNEYRLSSMCQTLFSVLADTVLNMAKLSLTELTF